MRWVWRRCIWFRKVAGIVVFGLLVLLGGRVQEVLLLALCFCSSRKVDHGWGRSA